MTIPVERTRAVLNARQFLCDLLDPKATPKVPRSIRQRASRVLRHYPGRVDMMLSARDCKRGWGDVEHRS